jgi:hypothetical protein
MTRSVGVGLLLLSGCDVAKSMQDEFTRLTSTKPASPRPQKSAAPPPTRPSAKPATSASSPSSSPDPPAPAPAVVGSLPLAGKSESEIRAVFGSPNAEEERPPGKRWRYRDGPCTLDIQLYPNVETKQFTTLAYDVRSNVHSDEGKRLCMAQFRSRLGNAQ